MKKIILLTYLSCILMTSLRVSAQTIYRYTVDLTSVTDDQLSVDLLAPAIKKTEINFYLPKIVPGTYMNSNYGKYVHNLKAFDKSGKELKVTTLGDNGWRIKKENTIYRISYQVEDTWDASISNIVYPMCCTRFVD